MSRKEKHIRRIRNREVILEKFPNYIDPPNFIKFLLLEQERQDRTQTTFSLLKISLVKKPSHNGSLTNDLLENKQFINRLYLNIRSMDYWTYCNGAFYINFVNCKPEEAEKCKERIEKKLKFLGRNEDSSNKGTPIYINFVNVEQTILEIQRSPTPPRSPGNGKLFSINAWKKLIHIILDRQVLPLSAPVSAITPYLIGTLADFQYFCKRLFDILFGLFLLIFFAPLMFILSVAIYLDDPGSAIFRQKRIGYLGIPFYIYKFRTMKRDKGNSRDHQNLIKKIITSSDKEEDLQEVYQEYINSRLTRLGRYLRKLSLDELPQLVNVIKNEMSLVGPRPHPEYEVKTYQNWYFKRLLTKPGLTGLSKVEIRFSPEDYEKAIRLDIRYFREWSLGMDLKILFKTLKVLLVNYE